MAVRKFEDALARLEVIVSELEQGELPMDASLKIFEEGVRLSRARDVHFVKAGLGMNILRLSGGEIVDHHNRVPLRNKAANEMGTNEPCPPSH